MFDFLVSVVSFCVFVVDCMFFFVWFVLCVECKLVIFFWVWVSLVLSVLVFVLYFMWYVLVICLVVLRVMSILFNWFFCDFVCFLVDVSMVVDCLRFCWSCLRCVLCFVICEFCFLYFVVRIVFCFVRRDFFLEIFVFNLEWVLMSFWSCLLIFDLVVWRCFFNVFVLEFICLSLICVDFSLLLSLRMCLLVSCWVLVRFFERFVSFLEWCDLIWFSFFLCCDR